MSLEDLANHLRIEEELRVQDESKKHISKIHVVKDGESSQGQKGNKKRPNNNNKKKKGNEKRDCTI